MTICMETHHRWISLPFFWHIDSSYKFLGERKGSRSKSKPTEKQAESYVIVMYSIRNNTLLAVTINTARSIIVQNGFQCTKETKIRQVLDS